MNLKSEILKLRCSNDIFAFKIIIGNVKLFIPPLHLIKTNFVIIVIKTHINGRKHIFVSTNGNVSCFASYILGCFPCVITCCDRYISCFSSYILGCIPCVHSWCDWNVSRCGSYIFRCFPSINSCCNCSIYNWRSYWANFVIGARLSFLDS